MYEILPVINKESGIIRELCSKLSKDISRLLNLLNVRYTLHTCLVGRASGSSNQANNYFFKVNYRNTRKRCELCSKLTIEMYVI